MANNFKILITILLFIFISGCEKKVDEKTIETNNDFPEIEYINAKKLLDEQRFNEAQKSFNEIEKKYPLSNWSLKSKIMSIFIDYLKLDYENASINIQRFINKYPDYKDIDYAYYLKALISYEQIKNPALDATYTSESQKNFKELIRRFPTSKYSKDAEQKLILIETILAGKDMHIGFYYLQQKKYLAALNRYIKIVDNYKPNKYTPEALHRIVEIYYSLGMIGDAERVAAVLGYNYPESDWYMKSYKLVGKKEVLNSDDKSWASKLLNKIK